MTEISHAEALQQMQPEVHARLNTAERAALAAHLAGCAGCRAAAEELAALDETLTHTLRARWAGARPAPDARARVRARLEGHTMPRRLMGFAGAVAGLAVLALVAWLLSQMVPGPARPAVTVTPPAATSAPVAGTPTPFDTPDRAPGGTPALGKVAYVQDGDIWVKALPAGAPQRLTEGGGHLRPRWSPSGAWLTFEQDARLWLVRADGTGAHAVADIATEGAYAWSPVDDRLAFVYSPGQICLRAGAALAGESATGERCVTLSVASGLAGPPQGPETDRDLRWSPDGSEVAFVREWAAAERSDGGRDYVGIWTLAAQGESLPIERYGVAAPADGIQLAGWSPGGRALLYWTIPLFSSSIAADGAPLWAVTLDGQAPAPSPYVTLPYDDYVAGSAAPEQLALVVGSGRETWNNKQLVWAYGDAAQPVTLTQAAEAAAWPAFVPDGTRLAYVAMPAAPGLDGDALRGALMARRIWIAEPGTQAAPRQLVDDAAYRDERPQWSADGAWILFARFDAAGKASLWLVSSAGGEAQRVVDVLGGTVDQQAVPDPLGFYGHVDWDSVYSWWRGAEQPPAVPTLPPVPAPAPQPTLDAALRIGGGVVTSGPFTFDLWLYRDGRMTPDPSQAAFPYLTSDLPGAGVRSVWTYHGAPLAGAVTEAWGIAGDLGPRAGWQELREGWQGGHTEGGILLPGAQAGDTVRWLHTLTTPQGVYGAVLEFTLQAGADGLKASGITVKPFAAGNP